jgi:N-acyl-D-aspartate/D-glutamate deacylase
MSVPQENTVSSTFTVATTHRGALPPLPHGVATVVVHACAVSTPFELEGYTQ